MLGGSLEFVIDIDVTRLGGAYEWFHFATTNLKSALSIKRKDMESTMSRESIVWFGPYVMTTAFVMMGKTSLGIQPVRSASTL